MAKSDCGQSGALPRTPEGTGFPGVDGRREKGRQGPGMKREEKEEKGETQKRGRKEKGVDFHFTHAQLVQGRRLVKAHRPW